MKKTNQGFIVPLLIVIIAALAIVGAYIAGTKQPPLVDVAVSPFVPPLAYEVSATSSVGNDIQCAENSRYFVVTTQIDEPNRYGADSIIKYKTPARNTFACTYTFEEGDYKIANSGNLNGLVGDNVIFDNGTTNYRGVEIYDLRIQKRVYEGDSHGSAEIVGNTLKMRTFQGMATSENECTDEENFYFKKDGIQLKNIALERNVVLDLNTLMDVGDGSERCSYRD